MASHLESEVIDVIKALNGREGYSEFKLAEALGKDVNATRNLLYKLHNLNLASFVRKKDQKIGWYICYWTFHGERVSAFLLAEIGRRLEVLKEKQGKEAETGFFTCANRCGRLEFDNAFDFSFRCPECGELLAQDKESGAANTSLTAEVKRLEKEIKALNAPERE